MKNSLTYLLLTVSTTILLSLTQSGCQMSSPYKAHLKTVDSLQTTVRELAEIVEDIDYDHYLKIREDMMKDMGNIEGYFISRSDTMPRNLALKLSEYRLVWKGYKSIEKEYERVSSGVNFAKEQLETLHHDLEQNAIGETLANRFVKEEREAINLLALDVNSFATKMEQTEVKYKLQKPVIVQLADSLSKTE